MHMESRLLSRLSRKALFFTLILLIALVLFAALIVAVPPGRREKSKREQAELDLRNLRSAVNLYRKRAGHYPTTADGLNSLIDLRILTAFPKDPWGDDYVYTSENGKLILMSFGRDGVPGGVGPDEDIKLDIEPDNK